MKYSVYILLICATFLNAQKTISVPDNCVTENIPVISKEFIKELEPYSEYRSASFINWNPVNGAMMISTRFGNSNQLHEVGMPGGARKQLTFFSEPVSNAVYHSKGDYCLFLKDNGGDEFTNIYRYDFKSKKTSQLTDGIKTQDGNIIWNKSGNRFTYSSTRRNKKDRDIWLMEPDSGFSSQLLIENNGGGWHVQDWSADNRLLMEERLSVSESAIYLYSLSTKEKKKVLPEKDEKNVYHPVGFDKNGMGFYLISNKEKEFTQLAYYDLTSKKLSYITGNLKWGVESAKLSEDGNKLAFIVNENGISKLFIMETTGNTYVPVMAIPDGIIGDLEWHPKESKIGFTFSAYNTSSDAFEYNTETKKLVRWTESETGGMNTEALQAPELITWKSFDGKEISGYLYKASKTFEGKRPVIIQIHGGPESQSRPGFLGRMNYFLNELGISIIYPNVRGSTGYGKTYVDADNGLKRMDAVKDIGALFDWIKKREDLDDERVMVSGGSYGGFMSLAVSYMYADKIRCAIDVVGISNFSTFLERTETYRRDLRRVEYGDERVPEIKAMFDKISPSNNADKIKKPLFIIQGGNDPRVPLFEAEQMKEKIKANNGTVWYLMAKDEGHGFKKKNNQDYQFYSTVSFIKTYLLSVP
jgi:dipeptidyl aminopeptidase/acylaminoacyl peptidase